MIAVRLSGFCTRLTVLAAVLAGAPPLAHAENVSGRWTGTYTNSLGGSGTSTTVLIEAPDGSISGQDGATSISTGRHAGNTISWKKGNACRQYSVTVHLSKDGGSFSGNYDAVNSCSGTTQRYTGRYVDYAREGGPPPASLTVTVAPPRPTKVAVATGMTVALSATAARTPGPPTEAAPLPPPPKLPPSVANSLNDPVVAKLASDSEAMALLVCTRAALGEIAVSNEDSEFSSEAGRIKAGGDGARADLSKRVIASANRFLDFVLARVKAEKNWPTDKPAGVHAMADAVQLQWLADDVAGDARAGALPEYEMRAADQILNALPGGVRLDHFANMTDLVQRDGAMLVAVAVPKRP